MIVPVLVCFVLILMISAALLRRVEAERGLSRQEQRRLQAEWLAEAGLDRAAARLSQKREYSGETWEVPAEELGGYEAGRVSITVEAPKGAPSRRAVTVVADYPVAVEHRARERRALLIELPTGDKGDTP
jgi:hypothetical protein